MNEEKPIINFGDASKLFGAEGPAADIAPVEKKEVPPQPVQEEKPREGVYPKAAVEKKDVNWKSIGFWVVIIIGAFVLGFVIVNGPALGMKISQWFKSIRGTINYQEQIYTPNTQVSDAVTVSTSESLADNHLIIPKINVDAPIQWNIKSSEVENNLNNGLVHYEETALPDQAGGNVFITGHSSNFWWVKSDYNQVFALLGDLEIGDKMVLAYQGKKYVYQVYDKFVVDPTQVEVLNSIEGKSTLTLMSCVPIGTNYRRLIIRSELLYSDEGKPEISVEETPAETTETTPGVSKPTEQQPTQPQPSQPSTDLFLPGV